MNYVESSGIKDYFLDMIAKLRGAGWNVHLAAALAGAAGVMASVYLHDPVVQQWIAAHWWANDLVHGLTAAVPPLLVYFGITPQK